MIKEEMQKDVIDRLSRIEGQIRGITQMVKQKRYCVDIILQIIAVESALQKVCQIIMKNHLETCVLEAFRSKNPAKRKTKIDEIMKILANFRVR